MKNELLTVQEAATVVGDLQASVVWVTHTRVCDVELLLASHQVLREKLPVETRVIVGGGALSPALRRSLHWCEYFETISQMVQSELNRIRFEGSGVNCRNDPSGASHN